eukprot:3687306-Prorocentrum_lima.AAC.1
MAPADVSARSMADAAIPPMPLGFPRKILPGEELTQEQWDALEVHERHTIKDKINNAKAQAKKQWERS